MIESSVMERFWNIVHYFAYRAVYKLYLASNKFSLIFYIYKLPFCKKHFIKKGYDPVEKVNEAFKRPDIGLSTIFAGGLMYGLPMIFFFGLHCFYIAFVAKPKNFESFLIIFISYSIISFLFSYILLFHKDKYLKYFREFDKKPRKWKLKWAWISFGVILLPFVVLASSFAAMTK